MKDVVLLLIFISAFGVPAFAQPPSFDVLVSHEEWLIAEKARNAEDAERWKKIICIISSDLKSKPFRFNSSLTARQLATDNTDGINVTMQIPQGDLVFEDFGGVPMARLKYFIRVTSTDGKFDRVFEKRKDIETTYEILKNASKGSMLTPISHNFSLPAGVYRIGVRITDLISLGYSERLQKITVTSR